VDLSGSPSFRDEPVNSHGQAHEGTDIFAKEGTPVFAVDDGHVRFGHGDIGGNVARLVVEDGTTYYYAHLASFEGTDRDVKAGDTIGRVGRTGNARGTSAHLHFGIYPLGRGVPPIDPFAALTKAAENAATRAGPTRPVVTSQSWLGSSEFFWLVVLYFMNKKRAA
jgi:murein DD-endopeptidase MepM/ murein hydrolase activator NlpD